MAVAVLYEPSSITGNGVRAMHFSGCLLGFLIPDPVKDNNFFERLSQAVCSHLALLNKQEVTSADNAVCSMYLFQFCRCPNLLHNLHLLH